MGLGAPAVHYGLFARHKLKMSIEAVGIGVGPTSLGGLAVCSIRNSSLASEQRYRVSCSLIAGDVEDEADLKRMLQDPLLSNAINGGAQAVSLSRKPNS